MGNDSRQLGWALIGCGSAGREHARGAAADADIAVRGFCDIEPAAAAAVAGEHDGAWHTTDPVRVFSDPEIDVVSIATAHDSHADLAIAALQAGKHLFLEKPMAMTSADCLRIEAARAAADRRLMLNHSIRFSGAARAIRERLGPIMVSHGQCTMAPADLNRWRWHPTQGGGTVYDVGVHALDLLCWMHRDHPVEVYATGGAVRHPEELRGTGLLDTIAATLRFADGGAATFLMADAGQNELTGKWFFEFFDGSDSAVLHEHFRAATITRRDPETGEDDSETLRPEPAARFGPLVAAIRAGTGTPVGPAEGIRTALLVELILESIATGQPQRWSEPASA